MIAHLLLTAIAVAAQPASAHKYKCDGRYGSFTCEHALHFGNCKQSLVVKWPPILYPGASDVKNKRQAWCSVIWNSVESVEERKYSPAVCERLMGLLWQAHQQFSEIPWQDTPCTHLSTNDAVLYTREFWEKPTKPLSKNVETIFGSVARPAADPEPKTVGLADVRYCTLHNPILKREKLGTNAQTPVSPQKVKAVARRELRCEVLAPSVLEWLNKFFREVGGKVIVKNPLR